LAKTNLPATLRPASRFGAVFFAGSSTTLAGFNVLIPLYIAGTGIVCGDGLSLDMDHYYHIRGRYELQVPEGSKLVALILSFP
jgi:hypothetical protein